jgi:phage tail sheath protein FI
VLPDNSDYAAFYFPWLQVFDPATMVVNPASQGLIYMPPSGHIAGIYARVDTARGVHKAPANEVVRGALDLRYKISKSQQDGLNPQGVNAIRDLNGNIRVWGARTIGGDANGEWRYINVRRLLLFLRESIDEGTQWVVFEPNTPDLWAKITRNVTAFLTNVWRAGALFGTTPQEAFYVKCDAETNPPALRDLGQVVTEIGVAPVKPAEFVIFRISQWAGPGS